MSTITDFINSELYPLLFDRVPSVFPSMDFQKYREGWASKYKLNGETSHDNRREKSYISPRKPNRIIEQGGESLTLIDFYMRLNNKNFIEAVKELCSIVGAELPQMEGAEEYKAYKEKQDRLEALNTKLRKSLFTSTGEKVLKYLKEGRGYSEEFIKWAEFGCIEAQSMDKELSSLREVFTYTDRDGVERNALPYGVGTTYTLTIPYRTGGAIKGFVFRSILPEEQLSNINSPKYKDAFISGAASKKYNLFGLTGLTLTGDKERDRYITIVEGEIDALRASFEGIKNVVAASGGNVSKEALQEIKRRGVKGVTLLFDTEETKEKQAENHKKLKKAIATIEAEGLSTYVCYLPSTGGKVDVDSYLRDHTGEQLQEEIDRAEYGYKFLFTRLLQETIKKQGGEGAIISDKLLSDFTDKTIDLCNSSNIRPDQRDLIFSQYSECTGGNITKEGIADRADALKLAQDKNRQKEETISLTSEALLKAKEGKVEEALSVLQSKLPDLKRISKDTEYSKLLSLPTKEGIRAKFKERPTGVGTSYAFNHNGEQEQFILPTGALTYICAPTSHGKSRMLENLALQLSQNGEEGDTLYFTFEEDETAVTLQLLNIYAKMRLSNNNLRTLNSHYTGKGDFFSYGVKQEFERKEAEFYSLLESGKLRVFYRDYDSSELIEAIRYYTKQKRVKAVFIDYIQLLHKKGCSLNRKDELKEICKDFMTLAVDTSLPVVLAAQLNREAYSPIEMAVQNIAEASDIEHSANIVLLLWNSKVRPIPQKSSYFVKKNGTETLSDEALKLDSRGFKIGEEGTLYATLAKNRGGARNIDAVLDFDGNTGVIKGNRVEEYDDLPEYEPDKNGAVR